MIGPLRILLPGNTQRSRAGYKPTTPESERPQTHNLSQAANGTSTLYNYSKRNNSYTSLDRPWGLDKFEDTRIS